MAEAKTITNRSNSASPEPNCAICLGNCTNKCFSDSCMHQFCFKCLLEWSKIKAECPLCKQPFKSIIHNVKSNDEYDEHIVETIPNEDIHIIDEQFLYLPQPTRHQFHFRTTFTVDTRGEHAIQQMLLSHPLTNGGISIGYPGRNMYHRRRRDTSATSFRRSIYSRNLWVTSPPDVTGRYRDVSPPFYRACPGARTRLVPWLNRELNALLYENTQLIMRLVDIILEQLLRHHICSRTFRSILSEYLGNKTDHFVHEFYNFMRSPFDMIGYDRHIIYTERPTSPAPFIDVSDNDSDSDVILVSASNPNEPVVIDLVNTDSDEPILVSEQPAPPPERSSESSEVRLPILPLKLRLKHKRQSREKRMRNKKRRRHRSSSSSSTSSSSSSSSSDSSSGEASYMKYKRRRKLKKKMKKKEYQAESSDSVCQIQSTDSENVPLSTFAKKKYKKHSKRKNLLKNPHKSYTVMSCKEPRTENESNIVDQPSCSRINEENYDYSPPAEPCFDLPSCSNYNYNTAENSSYPPPLEPLEVPRSSNSALENVVESNAPSTSFANGGNSSYTDDSSDEGNYLPRPVVKSEIHDVKQEDRQNGESSNSGRLRSIFIKKEESSNMWYTTYPYIYNSDASDC